jgi:predicted transposase YbfD/YdcC
MGCQTKIVKQIVEASADYVIAVKDNQPKLHEQIKNFLDSENTACRLDFLETIDKGHGRLEIRNYAVSTNLDQIFQKDAWPGLKAIGVAESIRSVQGVVSKETRYFITSLTNNDRFKKVVRDHWSIENSQHHVLDVQFGGSRPRLCVKVPS